MLVALQLRATDVIVAAMKRTTSWQLCVVVAGLAFGAAGCVVDTEPALESETVADDGIAASVEPDDERVVRDQIEHARGGGHAPCGGEEGPDPARPAVTPALRGYCAPQLVPVPPSHLDMPPP